MAMTDGHRIDLALLDLAEVALVARDAMEAASSCWPSSRSPSYRGVEVELDRSGVVSNDSSGSAAVSGALLLAAGERSGDRSELDISG
jgi:hypothetical protein